MPCLVPTLIFSSKFKRYPRQNRKYQTRTCNLLFSFFIQYFFLATYNTSYVWLCKSRWFIGIDLTNHGYRYSTHNFACYQLLFVRKYACECVFIHTCIYDTAVWFRDFTIFISKYTRNFFWLNSINQARDIYGVLPFCSKLYINLRWCEQIDLKFNNWGAVQHNEHSFLLLYRHQLSNFVTYYSLDCRLRVYNLSDS